MHVHLGIEHFQLFVMRQLRGVVTEEHITDKISYMLMSQKSLTIFKTCKIVQRLCKFAKGIEVLKNSSKKIKILRKY